MKNYIADGNFGPVEQPAAATQHDELAEDQRFRNWVHKTGDEEPDYSCQGTETSDPITRKGMLANQDYKALGLHKFSLEVNADKLPDFAGWQPPLMYDVATDTKRLVTQADVDEWQLMANTFVDVRRQLYVLQKCLERYAEKVKK